MRSALGILLGAMVAFSTEHCADAKSYSSGGGHSYSSGGSHSSSHSSSFSSSRSSSSGFGGGSSRSSSFSSGSGKSYSSGSSSFSFGGGGGSYSSGSNRKHSYSSGGGHSFTSSDNNWSPAPLRPQRPASVDSSSSSSSGMTFDTGAARAAKQADSKRDFNQYKQSQAASSAPIRNDVPPVIQNRSSSPGYSGPVPPVINRTSASSGGGGGYYGGSSSSTVWYPSPQIYTTRSIRIHNYYAPYYSRPVVVYNDNYNGFFWWWLLDQSLDDRAWWVYHHRYDMDEARYRALVYQDLALENRVQELEARQAPRDPNYVPAGMDRDLMYNDTYVDRAYANRPTYTGRIIFWFIMLPTAIAVGGFCIWLVFFKRWQTSTA